MRKGAGRSPVSRNSQAQAGYEGESEAIPELHVRKGAERSLKGVGLPLARTLLLATPSCVGGGPSRARVRQGGARLRGHDNAGIKKAPLAVYSKGRERQATRIDESSRRPLATWRFSAYVDMATFRWERAPAGASLPGRSASGPYKRRGPRLVGRGP